MKSFSLMIRLLPIAILLLIAGIIYIFGFSTHFSLENLQYKQSILLHWHKLHPILLGTILFCTYVISICLLIPSSTLLTLLAGMLYPLPYALLFSVISETLGALFLFYIIRYAIPPSLFLTRIAKGGRIQRIFAKNPASYLLCSRFSHVIPSWLITASAACLRTRTQTMLWTTFLGNIPICYLIAQTGNTLHHIEKIPHSHEIITPQTKLLFLGFSLLALLPVFFKKRLLR